MQDSWSVLARRKRIQTYYKTWKKKLPKKVVLKLMKTLIRRAKYKRKNITIY